MESAMEQARYWMWEKSRKYSSVPINISLALNAPSPLSYYSWEEAAFAKDTVGDLWGSVWPPRSYTCSFCSREFRSAQALGGHMNVHRRDRARLKQEATSSSNSADSPNPNPNTDATASLSVHAQEICRNSMLVSPCYPETPTPCKNVSIDLKLGERNCKRSRDDCWDDESSSYKMLRVDDGLALALSRDSTNKSVLLMPTFKSEVPKLITCQVEELDLELRLGNPPKVEQSCSIIVLE